MCYSILVLALWIVKNFSIKRMLILRNFFFTIVFAVINANFKLMALPIEVDSHFVIRIMLGCVHIYENNIGECRLFTNFIFTCTSLPFGADVSSITVMKKLDVTG